MLTDNTFSKEERLCSRKAIERLFEGHAGHSMTAFPLRAVWMKQADEAQDSQILVSVPKRCFKRAVKRNRVKRQVREAYRRHKQLLMPREGATVDGVVIAFIWLDDNLWPSAEVEKRVVTLLNRVAEKR